ncbi:hypothetical protein GUJ93_ZPchr0003g17113 [Zizania palustris]|uniref:Uncharacterized protein n=1 Tax=Zizania palustris TaxID=103762 RepID=A0A8J5RV54_ZIZPA|nr:hypothetical protein GUJ93_ZPchr0003g17113 [Zizania palustris]
MIPHNSTVVVRRRVAGPPAETIVVASSPKSAPAQSGGSLSDSGDASSAPSTGWEPKTTRTKPDTSEPGCFAGEQQQRDFQEVRK